MSQTKQNGLLVLALAVIFALASALVIVYNNKIDGAAGAPDTGSETRWGEMAWDEGKWG